MLIARPAAWRSTLVLLALALPAAALLGLVVALGILPLTLLMAGAIAALFFLALPTTFILYALLALTFVLVGLGLYYLRIDKLHWIPYAIATALWVKLPVDALRTAASPPAWLHGARRRLPPLVLALLCFFAASLMASLVNETPPLNILFGGKHYILIWSVAFAFASASVSDAHARRMWLLLLVIALLQAPFALLQHFIAFGGGKNWDAVVGTFGGDPEGSGGGSGHLAIFLLMALGLAVALGKDRQIGRGFTLAICVGIVVTVLMAETKIFFFVAPVVLAVVLWRDVRRRPLVVLGTALAACVVLVGILVYYQQVYYDQVAARGAQADSRGIEDYFDYVFAADAKQGFINRHTGEVGRIETVLVWARDGGIGGPQGYVMGYGITASRASPLIGMGEAQRHFDFNLKTTLVSVLLWDTGLLGTLAFAVVLGLLGTTCWRLAVHPGVPPFEQSLFTGCTAVVAVAFASWLYNDGLLDAPTLQIALALVFGFALRWSRRLDAPASAASS